MMQPALPPDCDVPPVLVALPPEVADAPATLHPPVSLVPLALPLPTLPPHAKCNAPIAEAMCCQIRISKLHLPRRLHYATSNQLYRKCPCPLRTAARLLDCVFDRFKWLFGFSHLLNPLTMVNASERCRKHWLFESGVDAAPTDRDIGNLEAQYR